MTLIEINTAAVEARRERRFRMKNMVEAVVEHSRYAKSLDRVYSITREKPDAQAGAKTGAGDKKRR